MAIGGIIAAIGFVSDVQNQVISFVAASVIAPGLEPLAKLPLGIVLRQRECLLFGLRAFVVGYSLMLLSAIITFYLLQQLGDADPQLFLENDFTKSLRSIKPKDWFFGSRLCSQHSNVPLLPEQCNCGAAYCTYPYSGNYGIRH